MKRKYTYLVVTVSVNGDDNFVVDDIKPPTPLHKQWVGKPYDATFLNTVGGLGYCSINTTTLITAHKGTSQGYTETTQSFLERFVAEI